MVRSNDSGSLSVAPFLKKCYEMVDDKSTNPIISWTQTGDSFLIWDITEFSVQLLPKYFKHNNFSSFIRQLNIYGFRKIDTDHWEFANDGFIRGQKHMLKSINRKKNSHATEHQKALQQQDESVEHCEKVENVGLWKEVENLKTDKNVLMQELVNLRQHQETSSNKLFLLRDQLQGMEKNQQQMLSFLVMVMQSPGFLVQLLHKKEHSWRMAEPGSIIEEDADDSEPLASDGMIVRYQPMVEEEVSTPVDEPPMVEEEVSTPVDEPTIVPEKPRDSDPSSDGTKDFSISPDFLKVLMDENLSSFENHAPFFLPELGDDGEWENFLLASPISGNVDDTEQDTEVPTDDEVNVGKSMPGVQLEKPQNFDLLLDQWEKSQQLENIPMDHEAPSDDSQTVEILTKKLGLLASDSDEKQMEQ